MTKSGLVATVTGYRNTKDIDISYSNGEVRLHTRYRYFTQGVDAPSIAKSNRGTNKKECLDHLGNKYPSQTAMLKAYNIHSSTFKNRTLMGWDLEKILTYKGNSNYKQGCTDHLGQKYDSELAMCRAYNIKHTTFQRRINEGWALKDALTKPVISTTQEVTDPLGRKFKNKSEMCKAWGVRRETLNANLKKGMSLEEALRIPTEDTSVKYNDKTYKSLAALAKEFNVNYGVLADRMRKGDQIDEAVRRAAGIVKEDHTGEENIMNCGLKLTITEHRKGSKKDKKNLTGNFEDGTIVRFSYDTFKRGSVGHPTLKAKMHGTFAGFTTKKAIVRSESGVFYECTCNKCGIKDILTPQQMMEHEKICQAK